MQLTSYESNQEVVKHEENVRVQEAKTERDSSSLSA